MLLELLSSSVVSGLFGGLFGWLNKRTEQQSIKMKYDYDLAMLTAKTDAMVETAKIGIETAKIAGSLLVEKIEANAFKESQKTSALGYTIKSAIRPVILGVLLYQMWVTLNSLETLTGGLSSLPEKDIIALYKVVILSIVGLTSMSVGWYFAARTSKQFDKLTKNIK